MKKEQAKETLGIIDGPKHPFDLALCLIDPFPKPQQMFHGYMGGMRHPNFTIDIKGIHDKRESEKNQRIIDHLQVYWENPPIQITGLRRDEKNDCRWCFVGTLTVPSGTVGGERPTVSAQGWYNTATCKGRITFSNPK